MCSFFIVSILKCVFESHCIVGILSICQSTCFICLVCFNLFFSLFLCLLMYIHTTVQYYFKIFRFYYFCCLTTQRSNSGTWYKQIHVNWSVFKRSFVVTVQHTQKKNHPFKQRMMLHSEKFHIMGNSSFKQPLFKKNWISLEIWSQV